MQKSDKVLLLEKQKRKPIEELLAETEARQEGQSLKAASLGVSTVTYRAWVKAFLKKAL